MDAGENDPTPTQQCPIPTPSCGSKQEAPSTHRNSSSQSSVSIARGVASSIVLRWDRGARGGGLQGAVRWTANSTAWASGDEDGTWKPTGFWWMNVRGASGTYPSGAGPRHGPVYQAG